MSRTSRLFELINILRAHRMPVTADNLARDLGISPRSVYRDIETLRSLGAPIDGQAGIGFRLGDGFFLPEFALLPEEIDALILGLGWVRQRADPALARNSKSALAKILATTSSASVGHEDPPPFFSAASLSQRMDPPQVAQLRDAVRRQRKVASAMRMRKAPGRSASSGLSQSCILTTFEFWRLGAKLRTPFVTLGLIACR